MGNGLGVMGLTIAGFCCVPKVRVTNEQEWGYIREHCQHEPAIPNVPGIEASAGLLQGSQAPNNRLKPPFQMSSAITFGIPAA